MAKKPVAPAEPPRNRLVEALPLIAVAAAFAHSAVESWRKFGDLMVDNGRELDLPRRMLEGAALYSDVRYYWGPLAPYLNTLLYRLFGVSFDTLRVAGILSAALMCVGLYLLARHFLGRWASAGVAGAFVYLGGFAHLMGFPIFNFVQPFNCSATWGIVAAVFSVHLLLVHQRAGAVAPFLGSALLLGLTALTKMEVVFATGVAHAAFAITTGRGLRRTHLGGWALAAAVPLAVYAVFYARVGPALWDENLGALLSPASRHYVNRTMGLEDVGGSLWAMALSLGVLAATVLAAFVVGRGPSTPALAALGVAVFSGYAWLSPDVPQRAQVVVLGAGLGYAAWRWFRARAEASAAREAQRVVLWAFCLACLARIPLRAIPSHYGFYLLPPGLICVVLLLADDIPRILGSSAAGRRSHVVAALAMLPGLAASAYRHNHGWYALHTVELSTPRGTALVTPASPEPSLLKALAGFPPGTTVATVPQGAGLIFASGLVAADAMFSYLPMELQNPGADDRLLERWQAKPPNVIVWWRQDLQKVFGVKGFGVDYATRTGKWVETHYRPVTNPGSEHVVLVFNSPPPRPAPP